MSNHSYCKPFILFASGLLLYFETIAQNLIPNPNFDQIIACPTARSQVTTTCFSWRQYTLGTPDYFNSCATSASGVDVPINFAGNQMGLSDSAYAGFLTHNASPGSNVKEYIAATIPYLQIGRKYEISLSASLGDNSMYATDDIGVLFSSNSTNTSANIYVLNVTPQVFFTLGTTLSDKVNWTRLSGTFVADSAYNNIVIGGFKSYATMKIDTVATTGFGSFYYVDSVVLKLIDTLNVDYFDTLLCAGDSINVPYFAIGSFFGQSNVFKLQLSDQYGSFSNPIVIGTNSGTISGIIKAAIPLSIIPGGGYRLRIISTSPTFISPNSLKNILISNTYPTKPVASSNSPVCPTDTLRLIANCPTSGVVYVWSGPSNFFSTAQNPPIISPSITASGAYTVSTYLGGCYKKDTTIVTVLLAPVKPTVTNNGPICPGDTLKLVVTSSSSGISYIWTGPNNFTSASQNPFIINAPSSASGIYIASVSWSTNVCLSKDSTAVTVKPAPTKPAIISNAPLCIGDSLQLTSSTTTNGVSYKWTGPNSFTSSAKDTGIGNTTFMQAGNYIFTVTLNGCTSKDTETVVINSYPQNVTAGSNTPVCPGTTLNLIGNSFSSGVTWT